MSSLEELGHHRQRHLHSGMQRLAFEPHDEVLSSTGHVNSDLRVLISLCGLLDSNAFGLDNGVRDLS